MKKSVLWCLLTLTVIGACAMPGMGRFWQTLGPEPKVVLDRAMRAQTIDTLVARLNDHYVFPDKAGQIGALLRQRQREGSYDEVNNGYRLARQLTADVRSVARDLHMKVWFAPGLVDEAEGPAPASLAEWEQRNNFLMRPILRHMATRGTLRVGRLGGNIGYLKVSAFPERSS